MYSILSLHINDDKIIKWKKFKVQIKLNSVTFNFVYKKQKIFKTILIHASNCSNYLYICSKSLTIKYSCITKRYMGNYRHIFSKNNVLFIRSNLCIRKLLIVSFDGNITLFNDDKYVIIRCIKINNNVNFVINTKHFDFLKIVTYKLKLITFNIYQNYFLKSCTLHTDFLFILSYNYNFKYFLTLGKDLRFVLYGSINLNLLKIILFNDFHILDNKFLNYLSLKKIILQKYKIINNTSKPKEFYIFKKLKLNFLKKTIKKYNLTKKLYTFSSPNKNIFYPKYLTKLICYFNILIDNINTNLGKITTFEKLLLLGHFTNNYWYVSYYLKNLSVYSTILELYYYIYDNRKTFLILLFIQQKLILKENYLFVSKIFTIILINDKIKISVDRSMRKIFIKIIYILNKKWIKIQFILDFFFILLKSFNK